MRWTFREERRVEKLYRKEQGNKWISRNWEKGSVENRRFKTAFQKALKKMKLKEEIDSSGASGVVQVQV